MTVNAAVRTLHNDLTKMRSAEGTEKKTGAALTAAGVTEKASLANIASQRQSIMDEFTSATPPAPAAAQTLLNREFKLGQQQSSTVSRFDSTVTKDNKAIAKDKKAVGSDKKQALKDLHPAELHMSLKDTNRVRNELGLRSVNKVIRPPAHEGLTKAVNIATKAVELEQKSGSYDYTEAYGARTNYGNSPLTKQHDGRITFDCSGFVGAVYKAAGLAAPYTVGYEGTSFDVAGNKNMQKVSEGQAKPGDVVVFPDHIALYIGGGKCISMGQEGDPAVVSVAAEAAYNNRGVQGFYHLKGA